MTNKAPRIVERIEDTDWIKEVAKKRPKKSKTKIALKIEKKENQK